MSEDSLLLNFSTEAPPLKNTSKGRRNLPNRIKGPHKISDKRPASSNENISSKRPRHENASSLQNSQLPSASLNKEMQETPARSDNNSKLPVGSRSNFSAGVISSLFTGAPHFQLTSSIDAFDSTPTHPTNAPIDTSTFRGLRLDPLLVAHLEGPRMGIGKKPTNIQSVSLPALLHGDASRDVLLQSQTGSGKTLCFLLPIIQSLLPLCSEAASWIDRSVGTLAVILTPTRELARQIYEVLERLCNLHLSLHTANSTEEDAKEEDTPRRTRWLVPGLLCGGTTRNHEKSRLRKGLPILVATPGRLLDHLQNTASFDIGKCRWLVLDEADRLLEMGFQDTLQGIMRALDGRRRLALGLAQEQMTEKGITYTQEKDVEDSTGIKWWMWPRRTILCSATLDENVQVLAGKTLHRPIVLRSSGTSSQSEVETVSSEPSEGGFTNTNDGLPSSKLSNVRSVTSKFSAPAQLCQYAVIVPTKLRLVTLIALLRRAYERFNEAHKKDLNSSSSAEKRIIVFMSCTDSVDFHWKAMGSARAHENDVDAREEGKTHSPIHEMLTTPINHPHEERLSSEGDHRTHKEPLAQHSDFLPNMPIYRLHGSLSQADRIANLRAFSASPKSPTSNEREGKILFCTSVAARGLDLPDVGCVIQLDPPTEGGAEEYVHRIGRTARVGHGGESWIMLLPHERDARKRLEKAVTLSDASNNSHENVNPSPATSIVEVSGEEILRQGFKKPGDLYQSYATDIQLSHERWVINSEEAAALARAAFLAHIRAYATHPTSEKDLFHVRHLHLGHLAKSFALREAPATVKNKLRSSKVNDKQVSARRSNSDRPAIPSKKQENRNTVQDDGDSDLQPSAYSPQSNHHEVRQRVQDKFVNDVEARMYAKVRALGRQTKKGGIFAAHGADDFQIG